MSEPATHEATHAVTAGPHVGVKALGLILAAEITSVENYEARLTHPTWPGEQSGITIGVGYDLGYQTRDQFTADWDDRLAADATKRLTAMCGVTGPRAATALPALRDIVVPWSAARAVFLGITLPRYVTQTLDAFPGCETLPDEAFGALVSLVFNRGAGMGSPTDPPPDRRREMRGIRDAIAGGNFRAVPQLLLDMRRLWPDSAGLRSRRTQEAALFAESLPKDAGMA
jgi:hypothetical protein